MTALLETTQLHSLVDEILGRPYSDVDCWALVRHCYERGWGFNLDADPQEAAQAVKEAWWHAEGALPPGFIRPWDLLIFRSTHAWSSHVGIALDSETMVHTRPRTGVVLESIQRWRRHLLQVARLQQLFPSAIVLPPALDAPSPLPCPPETARLRIALTPVRGWQGHVHWLESAIPAHQPLAAVLPAGAAWERLIHNGRVVPPDATTTVLLSAGDEVVALPAWGIPAVIVPWLITIGIGLVISLASTALSFVLFPPAKPHVQGPFEQDEQTFGWGGIRTAQGPGAIVPVIYGKFRVGGQLLSASIDNAITEVHEGDQATISSVQAQATSPTLTMLLALGEGPMWYIDTLTTELNGQPITNFTGVEQLTRLGTVDQTPIPEFGETRNTFSDGREVSAAGIIYTTEEAVTAFILNVTFLEGLFFMNERGEKTTNVVNVGYRYRVSPAGAWTPASYAQTWVSGERTTAVRLGIRRQGLASAVYDIEVIMLSAASMDEARAKWKPYLESVTEIQPNTQSYPYTALLGIKAVATDQLQGALPNVTIEVWGRTVHVVTDIAGPEIWSDNPAECVLDLLTNTRYGFGIPLAEIDLSSFFAYAVYCNEIFDGEKRHLLNYVLDREVRGQPLLLEIMGGSRTMLVKSEGQWHARPTRNDLPQQLISAANCANVRITYTRDPDTTNVLEARFANETMKYAQDIQTWPSIENWPAVVHKASLELRGVTKPSRVQRALQFELNRRRLENQSLEFEAALDALVLQPHDVFRFSHPLPGWGTTGRLLAGSTQAVLQLDTSVDFVVGQTYHVYVRYHDGSVEVRDVVNVGLQDQWQLTLPVPLSTAIADPRRMLWAFGESSPETAIRQFRVVQMERTGELTIRVQAILHNGAIYDEPVALPLPIGSDLFNPLGPPPPLTQLIATELGRIQASGASYYVVNLSWDVAPLSQGYAPYGGAQILRRAVDANALAGVAQAGTTGLGTAVSPGDTGGNFAMLAHVGGTVMDYDDYTVIPGVVYQYRVVPVSGRGVPNVAGALQVTIHVTGSTGAGFFPGTPQNLRLLGQAVGVTVFEGRDIHIQWDPVPASPLFTSTLFVVDYVVEVWAANQAYLLRRTSVPAAWAPGTMQYTYTLEHNWEDHVQAGQLGAERTILFLVYARTNTNRMSALPASLQVTNPPPDMSGMIPGAVALFEAALIDWQQWVEPRDIASYVVYLDTITPPVRPYQDVAIAFRRIFPQGLLAGVTYYVAILPYDTFGPGIPSQIASFVPASLASGQTDTTPPSVPTNVQLTTGTLVAADGTIQTYVDVTWTASPESDVRGYEIQVRTPPAVVPTVRLVGRLPTSTRFENVPGNVTIFVKIAAYDTFRNTSAFTDEVSITTGADTTPPGAPTGGVAYGNFRAVLVLWTPPADLDYAYTVVFASTTNDYLTAVTAGTGENSFTHTNLASDATWYYWLAALDTSGNLSALHPTLPDRTTTIVATTTRISGGDVLTVAALITDAAQIGDLVVKNEIVQSLAASKIATGTLAASTIINVGAVVGGVSALHLDGTNRRIAVIDEASVVRVLLGDLGPLTTDYGLQLFAASGQLMWSFATGATTNGITDSAITAAKISAGVIEAGHLRADIAVITTAAQITAALIGDAHINALSANKIITGTLRADTEITVGSPLAIHLSGSARLITVWDEQPQARVQLGKLGAGLTDYGLIIMNAAGEVMWYLGSGATTQGITPLAVTEQVTQFQSTSSVHVDVNGVQLAFVLFPTVATGDQIWLSFTANVDLTAATAAQATLREDSLAGTALMSSLITGSEIGTLHTEYLFTAGVPFTNKTFVVQLDTNGSVTIRTWSFIALLRKR